MHKLLKQIQYYDETFPKKELEKIVRNKERFIPDLLAVMKDVVKNTEKYLDDDCMLYLYASYLLAQFQVTEFFDIFLDVLNLPDPIPAYLYDDSLTEDAGRIIASTYSGNTKRIYDLIENTSIDSFTRGAGISALNVLFVEGEIERATVVEYLRSQLKVESQRNNTEMVTQLVFTLADLYPEEALEDIREQYRQGKVDEQVYPREELQSTLTRGKDAVLEELRTRKYNHYVGNIIDEMGWWNCFKGEEDEALDLFYNEDIPQVKPVKIGRNDPCPCGSGKKHKHCCGK